MPKMSRQKPRKRGGKRKTPQFKQARQAISSRRKFKQAVQDVQGRVPGGSLSSDHPLGQHVQELHEEIQSHKGVSI